MSSHQYVYVMHRLSKAWPGGKEVLKNISLSFLPGAKIGVLGLNGAGKSTLLKIMAGLDTEFNGEEEALLLVFEQHRFNDTGERDHHHAVEKQPHTGGVTAHQGLEDSIDF